MDVNSGQDSEEADPHSRSPLVRSEMIVVKDAVIDPLTGGTILVDVLVLGRVSGNGWIQTDIRVSLDVHTAAIVGRRAIANAFAGRSGFAGSSKRAAEFDAIVSVIHALVCHTLSSMTNRDTVRSNGNGILYVFLSATLAIEVNERIAMPGIDAEPISRHVVVSRIQTDILDGSKRIG